MPLILSRKRGETIMINGPCTIRMLESTRTWARIEIDAAPDVRILRGELAVDPPNGHDLPRKIGGKWRYQPRKDT